MLLLGDILRMGANLRIAQQTARGIAEFSGFQRGLIAAQAQGLTGAAVTQTATQYAATAAAQVPTGVAAFLPAGTLPLLLKGLLAAGIITILAAAAAHIIKKLQTKEVAQAYAQLDPEQISLLEEHFRQGSMGALVPTTEEGKEAAKAGTTEYFEDVYREFWKPGNEFGEWLVRASTDVAAFTQSLAGARLRKEDQIIATVQYMAERPYAQPEYVARETALQRATALPPAERAALGLLDEEQTEIATYYYEQQQALLQIDADYAKDRTKLHQDFFDWRKEAERDYGDWYATTMRDHQRAEARYLEDYELRLSRIQEESQEEREKATEEHLRRLKDLHASHMDTLIDLLERRDARAIIKEIASYKRQREQQQEGFQASQQEREDQAAKQIAELEEDYNLARQRRLEDLNLEVADRQAALAQQIKDRNAALNEELKALRAERDEEKKVVEESMAQQLAAMQGVATIYDTVILPQMYLAAKEWFESIGRLMVEPDQEALNERQQAIIAGVKKYEARQDLLSYYGQQGQAAMTGASLVFNYTPTINAVEGTAPGGKPWHQWFREDFAAWLGDSIQDAVRNTFGFGPSWGR